MMPSSWGTGMLFALLLWTSSKAGDAFEFWHPPKLQQHGHHAVALVKQQKQQTPVVAFRTHYEFVLRQSRNENELAGTLANNNKQQWRNARVISSRFACPSQKSMLVELSVDTQLQQEYTTPGQFIQLRPNDSSTEPIFLAMSSAPSSACCFEFLIKMAPSLTWLRDALKVGNTLQISRVMGDGFASTSIPQSNTIILVAAGSGIAPLKACIETDGMVCSPAAHNYHTLYYGEWTADDLCFTELFDEWKSKYGINVVPVLSRTKNKMYVQDMILQQQVLTSPESTTAILCGMDDMIESCTKILVDKGVDKDHILLNL